jgi:hypothetical protein
MTCEVMNMPKEQILDNEGLFTLRLFSKWSEEEPLQMKYGRPHYVTASK